MRNQKNQSVRGRQQKAAPKRQAPQGTRQSVQHNLLAVPVAQGVLSNYNSIRMIQDTGYQARICGSEWLGNATATVESSAVYGGLSFTEFLNPLDWAETRTAALIRLYEKYRFISATIRYVGTGGTGQAGSVTLGIDYDPNDAPCGSARQAASYPGAITCPVWSTGAISWNPKCKSDNLWKFVDLEGSSVPRLCSEGIFNLWIQGGSGSGNTLGRITIDYVIEVCTPDNPSPIEKCLTDNLQIGVVESVANTGDQPLDITFGVGTTTTYYAGKVIKGILVSTALTALTSVIATYETQRFIPRSLCYLLNIGSNVWRVYRNAIDVIQGDPVMGSLQASPVDLAGTFSGLRAIEEV